MIMEMTDRNLFQCPEGIFFCKAPSVIKEEILISLLMKIASYTVCFMRKIVKLSVFYVNGARGKLIRKHIQRFICLFLQQNMRRIKKKKWNGKRDRGFISSFKFNRLRFVLFILLDCACLCIRRRWNFWAVCVFENILF